MLLLTKKAPPSLSNTNLISLERGGTVFLYRMLLVFLSLKASLA
jgi:hypothetical protein